jgi:nucleosome binding factor SPN SPT16 subunit
MLLKKLESRYYNLISFLKNDGFLLRKNINTIFLLKDFIKIEINIQSIIIEEMDNNRRYYFDNNESNEILIKFISILETKTDNVLSY